MVKKWLIIFIPKAEKEFAKLSRDLQKRIYKALKKLEKDPLAHLKSLHGTLGGLYKFRVGDYRLICKKEHKQIMILILKIAHRKHVYKK